MQLVPHICIVYSPILAARRIHWWCSQTTHAAAQTTSPILCWRATVIRHGLVSARRPAATTLFHGQERDLATEPSLWPVQLYGTVYQQQFVMLTDCIRLSAVSKYIRLLYVLTTDFLFLQTFVMHSWSGLAASGEGLLIATSLIAPYEPHKALHGVRLSLCSVHWYYAVAWCSLDLNAAESGVQHKPAVQRNPINNDQAPNREGCSC